MLPVTSLILSILFAALGLAGLDHRSPSGLKYTDPSSPDIRDCFIKRILKESSYYGGFPVGASNTNPIGTVGIIGAGAAGLYSALLLESLGVDYEILEANSRIGGRIWTYHFNKNPASPGEGEYYDYYDVGAMRFPGMPWMDRVIGNQSNSIVTYINSHVSNSLDRITVIPYIYQTDNNFLRYNDRIVKIQDDLSSDPFGIGTACGGNLPNSFVTQSPNEYFKAKIQNFLDALNEDFDAGFNYLMSVDSLSARQYFLNLGLSHQEIDWLETTNDATGCYDLSISQIVLEQWTFTAAPLDSWKTIDGGLDRLVTGLQKVLRKTVQTGKRVTQIKYASSANPKAGLTVVTDTSATATYAHVINTVPLGAMQAINMSDLNLDYPKKVAMRTLTYDSSVKIGIKFNSRWWQNLPAPFKGGQSFSDLPIRKCVYPSYGINVSDAAGTMIASYTWAQDASRLGSYLHTPEGVSALIDMTLHDLADMNNVTYEFLHSQYNDSHMWSWYDSEYSVGAYARFAPGQYITTMPALMEPAAHGRLHFAGEALSSGHSWIVGAVNSAYRAVAEVLAVSGRADLVDLLIEKWGTIDEVDMGWYYNVANVTSA